MLSRRRGHDDGSRCRVRSSAGRSRSWASVAKKRGSSAPDGEVLAVLRRVDVVERGPAVERVDPAFVLPRSDGEEAVHERRQVGRTVDHRRIDHLPEPRPLPFDEGGQDPRREVERPPAEVGDEVERDDRGPPFGPMAWSAPVRAR